MNITKKISTTLAQLSLSLFIGSAYSSTISPTQSVGSPFDNSLKLVGTVGENITITPTLDILVEHQGKKAELYALAMFEDGVWAVKRAEGWTLLSDGIPAFETVTLGKSHQFDLYNGPTGFGTGVDTFYGYRISDEVDLYYGNGFHLTLSTTARKLQDLMDTTMTTTDIQDGIPGMIMAVNIADEGYWIGATGVSDLETQKPMTEMINGQFRIGSITKTFTAMVILQLAEEGKLKLDDTIEQWLPSMVPNGEQITLRHLLNHTGGIPNFTNSMNWLVPYALEPVKPWTPEELVQVTFEDIESISPPGEEWHYSNTGYVLLALVAEKVTGNTWESEVRSRVIEPLGLKNTTVPEEGETAIAEEYIHGYWNLYEFTEGMAGDDELIRRGPLEPSYTWSSGNIISTLDDLSRWVTAIASGELLNLTYEDEQFAWIDASAFGLEAKVGLGIVQEYQYGIVGHRGQISGYDVAMQYDWDGGGAIITMMNRSIFTGGNIQQIIMYEALDILHGKESEPRRLTLPKPRQNLFWCTLCEYP